MNTVIEIIYHLQFSIEKKLCTKYSVCVCVKVIVYKYDQNFTFQNQFVIDFFFLTPRVLLIVRLHYINYF
jgi:hypothetical protein